MIASTERQKVPLVPPKTGKTNTLEKDRIQKQEQIQQNSARISGEKRAAFAGPSATNEARQEGGEDEEEEKEGKKDCLSIGDVIGGYLTIQSKVGEGGFGEVYTAFDTQKSITVAIKAENNIESTLLEMRVLTKFQRHKNCPNFYEAGRTRTFSYMAMQLLGRNLTQVRRACPLVPPRLSLATTYGVMLQCINAIEGLHDTGFIHRDIKPSNFAIGLEAADARVVYLFDFGLCRRYVEEDGATRPPRPKVGFRGTVRYASIAAHDGNELSRQDDFISLFYSLIELISGNLPWRSLVDKASVAELKRTFTYDTFCNVMPPEVRRFIQLVVEMRFTDRPPYNKMCRLFRLLMMQVANGIQDEHSIDYEWLNADCRKFEHWRPAVAGLGGPA